MKLEIDEKTVTDFGQQWNRFRDNEGYYGSVVLLSDIFWPHVDTATVRGLRVAEIGSGTGRIVNMLLDAGAREVTAVEPSSCLEVLKANTASRSDRVRYVHGVGETLPIADYDLILCIGVLHHIYHPQPVLRRMFEALKPGGRVLIWVYGVEGNELYLAFAHPLRKVTTVMPDKLLAGLSAVLAVLLQVYATTCRILPLPMRQYMLGHIAKLSWHKKWVTVFDQLNPTYAKYYSEREIGSLLEDCGFIDVLTYNRHGYSWTVTGLKPEA